MIGFLMLALLLCACFFINSQYKKQSYYQITKNPLLNVIYDTGKLGEFMTYRALRPYEKSGAKFLFNVYIPKDDGTTTEIDVMMITDRGLFVFESKNYSGWIFGNEKNQYWYQTLPSGRGKSHKEKFYNPILQNKSHIKHLLTFLGETHPTESVIVFSERCTLKQVEFSSERVTVAKREDIAQVVSSLYQRMENDAISREQMDALYQKLYPCTQADAAIKQQHIETIRANTEPQEPICPRCGGKLVLRTASRGENAGRQFYGCSNYPKCRFVQNLDDVE